MNTNIHKQIGARLRQLRKAKGETQKDCAEIAGITPAAYGKLEAGDRGLSPEYCIAFAEHFNVSCDYILRGIAPENVDVCTKTPLTQSTVDVLANNLNIENDAYSQFLYHAERYSMLQKRFEDNRIVVIPADDMAENKLREAHDQIQAIISEEQVENDEAEKFKRINKIYRISNCFLNYFIADVALWKELRNACFQFVESFEECTETYSMQITEGFQADLKVSGMNAARYIAGQAFAQFFSTVFTNADFYRQVSDLPECEIQEYIEKGLLHE